MKKALFIALSFFLLFQTPSRSDVRLDLSFSRFGIIVNHEFRNFEGILDLNASAFKFGSHPYFDSTVSQRTLYSYYTHSANRLFSTTAGLGFIRNNSRLKTGPMLFFRNDQYIRPYLINHEYNSLTTTSIYLGLGLVNKLNFKRKYFLENQCYVNGSLRSNTFFNYADDTTFEEFLGAVTPARIMTAGMKSCLLREFKYAGVGGGFNIEDYFRYYPTKEWNNFSYWNFFVELRLKFMKGYFREMKNDLKKIFKHDENSGQVDGD
jgi:hypothetical protein